MNGPEHYRAAEQLLTQAGGDLGAEYAQGRTALAQVHALLALAAATAMAGCSQRSGKRDLT